MTAATIILAREDLSIPGSAESAREGETPSDRSFFRILSETGPDVIVLDLRRNPAQGVATICKIRQRSQVPILAVCDPNQPSAQQFRIAGAAACIPAPIDLHQLNDRLQRIIKLTRGAAPRAGSGRNGWVFAGITFDPRRDLLIGGNGATAFLTRSESRLLQYFVSRPGRLCRRAELAAVLDGGARSQSESANDVVLNRLRRKLARLCGADATDIIRTEPRRGYRFAAVVAPSDGRDTDEPTA
jgi:DNA-binding response OmpR family regulator